MHKGIIDFSRENGKLWEVTIWSKYAAEKGGRVFLMLSILPTFPLQSQKYKIVLLTHSMVAGICFTESGRIQEKLAWITSFGLKIIWELPLAQSRQRVPPEALGHWSVCCCSGGIERTFWGPSSGGIERTFW